MGAYDQLEDYHRNGFTFPIPALTESEAAALRADLESAEQELADDPQRLALLKAYPDRLLPAFDALVRNPTILKATTTILGPDLMCWSGSLFIKEANSPHIVSWHQDLTYWGLDNDGETTCWLALTPANETNGAMKFVPGSHKTRLVEHRDTFDDNNLLSRGQEIAVDVNEEDAVQTVLKPGQMSMHHGHLFHASEPNTTNDRRIGVAIRYIKADMAQQDGTQSLVAHVAGEDRWGHFKVAEPPKGRLREEDFELCRADAEAKRKILYKGAEQSSGKRY